MYRSYHGSTSGSIAATGDPRRWPSEPSVPGIVHFMGPYLYRSSFHATTEAEECERALAHLDEVVMFEGAHTIAAVILEPVVGTNGVLVPPPGYLQGVRDLCDRHGIVLIADEVMAGFGRCGEWFSIQRWDVAPDLICFAKGVNSGYVPLGGVIISDEIAATFDDRVYPGGLTYSGHALACASAVASINIFRDEDVLGQARALGDAIGPALAKIAAKHPVVGEVRGLGAFWADRAGPQPGDPRDARAVQRERRRRAADAGAAGRLQGARRLAVHALQPAARRAAAHDVARRPRARAGAHRRRADRRRPLRHRLTVRSIALATSRRSLPSWWSRPAKRCTVACGIARS